MTTLSVNINKIALLRNSRGRDFPHLPEFTQQLIGLGCKGITVHPRPDERHVTRRDVYALAELLQAEPDVEFNIEGYPSPEFISMVLEVKPAQCTLVPDSPEQLTSDHGWNVAGNERLLADVLPQLRAHGIRSSLFMEPSLNAITQVPAVQADRIELYTEAYARDYGSPQHESTWQQYHDAAQHAQSLGLGVNAGHDLDLSNLAEFLVIPDILEVSIGHALVIESIQHGLPEVIARYHAITGG
ncbi:MAG: pyridoxine 5'-phosphate synthase [Pseudohongiellaceae bacterium]